MRIIESFREMFESVEVLEERLTRIKDELNLLRSSMGNISVFFNNKYRIPEKISRLESRMDRLQKMIEKRKSRK